MVGEIDNVFVGNFFESLPEGFVANALALTSPRDVCRLSLVCSVFRSAVEWDAVWEKFLPPEYQKILAEVDGDGGVGGGGSKKELYLRLCDHPVIIDGGNKSFSLDKCGGKKCYMAARDLTIVWGDTPRFTEVAELVRVCWLEVHGTINTSMLSTDARYVACVVYKLTPTTYGFEHQPIEVSIGVTGVESQTKRVLLDPEVWQTQRTHPCCSLFQWPETEARRVTQDRIGRLSIERGRRRTRDECDEDRWELEGWSNRSRDRD